MLVLLPWWSTAGAQELESVSGTLIEWVEKQDRAKPETLNGFAADPARRNSFQRLIEAMIAADWHTVLSQAKTLKYRVVTIRNGETQFHAAADASGAGRDPIVIVNPDAESDLIASAPHAPNERGTAQQAALLVGERGARAAVIAGADRCAARTYVACGGKTSVCGKMEGHRASDVSYNPDSLFHLAHTVLLSAWPNAAVISLHGMKIDRNGVRTVAVLSSGIRRPDPARAMLATKLRVALGALTIKPLRDPKAVVSCELPEDGAAAFVALCGYANVQGRMVNGGRNICHNDVTSGTGRFIHVEQDGALLRPFAENWKAVDDDPIINGFLDAVISVAPNAN